MSRKRLIELVFHEKEEITKDEILLEAGGPSEFGKFMHLADEGREPLMATMNFMISENTLRALDTIARGNNWQKIASCLATVFYLSEYVGSAIDLRVLKAKGYDRLRELVANCVADLQHNSQRLPEGYGRLVERLFKSQGKRAP